MPCVCLAAFGRAFCALSVDRGGWRQPWKCGSNRYRTIAGRRGAAGWRLSPGGAGQSSLVCRWRSRSNRFLVSNHPRIYVSVTFQTVSLCGHVEIRGVSWIFDVAFFERKSCSMCTKTAQFRCFSMVCRREFSSVHNVEFTVSVGLVRREGISCLTDKGSKG